MRTLPRTEFEAARKPEPVLALVQKHLGSMSSDPWKGIPELILYDDGTILFKNAGGQPRVGKLSKRQRQNALGRLDELGFNELPGFTDAVPDRLHQTLSYVLRRGANGWVERTRYGHSPTCEASRNFDVILKYVSSLAVANSRPWEPEEIEVRLYGPGDSGVGIPWPPRLPIPQLPKKALRAKKAESASYEYIWPIRYESRLRKLDRKSNTMLSPGVRLSGRNWWMNFRHHVNGRPILEKVMKRDNKNQSRVDCPPRVWE